MDQVLKTSGVGLGTPVWAGPRKELLWDAAGFLADDDVGLVGQLEGGVIDIGVVALLVE